jgi:hypothetical protein
MTWLVLWTDKAAGSTGLHEYPTREKARAARREFQAKAKEAGANYSYSVRKQDHTLAKAS